MIETRRNAQTNYRKYYGFLPFGIVLYDESGEIVYFNKAYSKIVEINETRTSCYHDGVKKLIQRKSSRQHGTLRIMNDEGEKPLLLLDISIHRDFIDERGRKLTVLSIVPVKNPLKGHILQKSDTYIFDDLRLFAAAKIVKHKGSVIPLSQTEFQLLAYLCANEDRVILKDELLKHVWSSRSVETRTVDITINRLRHRLKSCGVKRNYIKTLHGQGYIFEVHRSES